MGSKVKRQKRIDNQKSRRKLLIIIGCLGALAIANVVFYFWNDLFFGGSTASRAQAEEGNLPVNVGIVDWKEIDDPSKDGWDTEVVSGKIDKIFKKLSDYLNDPTKIDLVQLEEVIDKNFSCGTLLPTIRQTVFKDSVLTVERATSSDIVSHSQNNSQYTGAHGFAEALKAVNTLVDGAHDIHSKFKLYRITPESNLDES